MGMPKIEGPARRQPLCYDPERDKFISFDDIVSGREPIIPMERLSTEERKRLVVQRQRRGPDYRVRAMSGSSMSRDDVIQSILRDEAFGRAAVEAELSHLRDLLRQIEEAMKTKD